MSSLVKHGITKDTPSNIPLGAGTWFKGLKFVPETGWTGTVLGATSGGSSIKITPEINTIKPLGITAPMIRPAPRAARTNATVRFLLHITAPFFSPIFNIK